MQLHQTQPAKGYFQTCEYEMCQDEASAKARCRLNFNPLLSDELLPLIRGPIFIFLSGLVVRRAQSKQMQTADAISFLWASKCNLSHLHFTTASDGLCQCCME